MKTSLVAEVSGYLAGMEAAARKTRELGTETEKLAQKREGLDTLATHFGVIGTVAGAAFGIAVAKAVDFDAQMSKVRAATGATASDMTKFREQALTAGAAFGYTASQVTEAQVELGKAGLATSDILNGGLSGVLALAASDNVELGKATQIASVAMRQFNLEGKDVPHIADLLAAGAGKALGGVEQLGDALNQSGLVASNFGFSLEETTGVLSAFADAGLLGSDAGTSLKSMLQALANPSKESAQLMESLGINVKDANGGFLDATDLAQHLRDKLSVLTDAQRQQALAQIFGSDAVRAATVLYKQAGDGIEKYIKQNDDAGYALAQAAIKSDNLQGDLKKLQSAFDSALIGAGSAADGPLRALVQTAGDLVTGFSDAGPAMQATQLGLVGLVAVVGLGTAAFLGIVPRIAATKAALETLGVTSTSVKAKLSGVSALLSGPWGAGITIGVTAIALLNSELEKLKADSSEVTHVLKSASSVKDIYDTLGQGMVWSPGTASITDQLKDLDGALQAFASHNSDNGFQAILTRFTNTNYSQGINALRDINEEMGQLAQTDPSKATRAFKLLADQTDGSQKSLHRLVDAIGGDYRDALRDQADALGVAASDTNLVKLAMGQYADVAREAKDPTSDNADALNALQGAADQAAPSIDDVANALRGLTSPTLDAREAQRQLEAAVDDVTDTIEQNKEAYKSAGTSMDIATEEGRKNQAALDGIASSAQVAAGALYTQTGSQDQATNAMRQGRSELVRALGQYGITGQAAQDYANKIIGTPKDWATAFQNNASAAGGPVDAYNAKLNGIPMERRTAVVAATKEAQVALGSVLGAVNAIPSQKTITITTNRVNVGDGTRGNGLGVQLPQANGSVMDFYANGGLSEDHVAQIAPGGSWRVWAEPETEGEAYIPLAPSKRARSLAIWEETGRRLQAFADGGFSRPTYVPTPPQMVYAAAPSAAATATGERRVPEHVSFSFPSSGDQRKDMDEGRWFAKTLDWGARPTRGRD